ncbi:hypothetical protein M0R72_00010 [Candidatus Pacearchaeota archaeon]|jgi:hypothetical protein|nr:hypothetical protein [Candidatus Pacearchaeota archaeon]
MGYRIWRKDKNVWSLAFDTIYETQDKVSDAIAELKARYHDLMQYGELEFLPYLDHVKLARDGSIMDNTPYKRQSRPVEQTRRRPRKKYSIAKSKQPHVVAMRHN